MKSVTTRVLLVATGFWLVAGLGTHAAPLGTAFTYQGQLKEGGVPADGEFDFLCRLYDSDSGHVQLGDPCVVYDQPVTNGLFTVELDFGAGAFTGDAVWLEVAVRPSGSSVYAFLSPRQAVTAAPYALALPGLWTLNNATSPNVIGGWDQNSVSSGVVGGIVAGGGSPSPNLVTDHHGTVSGGSGNRAGDNDGTLDNAHHATVGGGVGNVASHSYATVGGGQENTATSTYNTIAGGTGNSTSHGRTTIGGGADNVAAGDSSTIGGGRENTTGGVAATVPGGWQNGAIGNYSFAAGRRAKANHPGAFVWADSTDADFESTGNNQLLIRAGGGVGIGTNLPSNPLSVVGNADINGNFGIATASPEVRLHVDGGTDSSLVGGGYMQLGATADLNLSLDENEIMARQNGAASTLYLNKEGGNMVLVQNSGNVGVGTAVPGAKLDIVATGGAGTGLKVSGTNGGIDAEGAAQGGVFRDSNNSGYAQVAHGEVGVFAKGNQAGAHFTDDNGSGDAWLAYTDDEGREWGIQAEGNKAGGRFFDADGTGEARVAYSDPDGKDYGIWTEGHNYGGHFVATATGVNSGTGVRGEGGHCGGIFVHRDSDVYGCIGTEVSSISGNGEKNFVQNHPYLEDRIIKYASLEGDEVGTYTRGTARLEAGEARVALGQTFKWVTNPDIGLTAHLTPRGHAVPLAVVSLTTEQLVVRGAEDGPQDVVFDYIVHGLRIGFEESSVVREKEREAYIPSMRSIRERYEKYPELRKYNSLERFQAMRAAVGNEGTVDLTKAHALCDAIVEFDPAIHRIERPERPTFEDGHRPSQDNASEQVNQSPPHVGSIMPAAVAETAKDRRIQDLEARLEALEAMFITLSGMDEGDAR